MKPKGTTIEAEWTAPRYLDGYEAEAITAAMFDAARKTLARFDKLRAETREEQP